MNVLGDYHSAADVLQDAFVKAYRELPCLQLFNAPTCDLHPSQCYGEWTLKRRSTAILAVSLWLGHSFDYA
ncbi:MAG: hypothetical protein NTX52_08560, partial [Planctomycetota bacterium]|nr:hypothetical protein [Planctomycetota bacterium]